MSTHTIYPESITDKTEICPNCFQPRGGANWHTLWSGGFTCERVTPRTTGDVIPDDNGQRLTTERGYYSDAYDAEMAERVFPDPKMFTTTTIPTRHEWINEDRMVSLTSGRSGLSLTVAPNPRSFENTGNTTGLTPDQAEKLGNDLLERVAEIRAGLKEEAGE